ncbi:kinase domain-containing protein [Clathrospora elynae]|uniref:non-specific serine/threonine protein kinase n=1 Tax=Clathrospora elynae TaxID=706981 RepID=A0A6A5SDR0_9PLEO|nr:kinase domain-containing protein [Clathrospora elynae]
MGSHDLRASHNSGAITPPATPTNMKHSKTDSASSDFLDSLSSLRRGDSTSSLSRTRLTVDEAPKPGSTELITFPHLLTDYEFRTDQGGRKSTIGEGAWSDVYLATPTPPKPTYQSSLHIPCAPDMTPPLTPVRTVDAGIGLNKLPATPPLYAVKVPAMTSAKKVLAAEARILSYIARFPDADKHVVLFYGLDTRTGAILLKAMDGTLESWIEKELNTLNEASRAIQLAAVFPAIASSLLRSLLWLQDKGCTHADIKPANILVSSSSGSAIPQTIYSDFSSTVLTTDTEAQTPPVGAGTWDYLDPSLLSSFDPALPSAATDLWSLAITLLFLVLGSSPYAAFKGNKFQQREMIKSGCPLQCMGYDDQGLGNVKRIAALSKDLGFNLQKWFAKVLVKNAEKRVGVQTWIEELDRAGKMV